MIRCVSRHYNNTKHGSESKTSERTSISAMPYLFTDLLFLTSSTSSGSIPTGCATRTQQGAKEAGIAAKEVRADVSDTEAHLVGEQTSLHMLGRGSRACEFFQAGKMIEDTSSTLAAFLQESERTMIAREVRLRDRSYSLEEKHPCRTKRHRRARGTRMPLP
jgi:hypothetical protein